MKYRHSLQNANLVVYFPQYRNEKEGHLRYHPPVGSEHVFIMPFEYDKSTAYGIQGGEADEERE